MKQQRRYKEPQDTLWGKFLSGFMAVVFAMSTLTLIPIASAINGEPNEAQIQQQEELADQTSGKDEKTVELVADEQKLEPVELLSIASVEDEDDADDAAPADATLKVKAQNATVTYNGNDVATELVVPADKDVKFTVKAADGFTLGAAAVKLADAKGETTLTPNAGEYTVAADRVADGATIVVTAEAVAGSTNTDAVEPSTPAPSTDLGEKMETAKSVVTDILANAFGTSALAADTGISPQSINGGKDLEIYVGSTTEIRSNNNNNRWVQNQTWSSADESIANVSGNESSATVTGNAIGTTTITYSYQYWSGGMIFGKWVDQTEKIKVTVVKAPQASLDEPVYVYAQVAYSNGVTTDLEGEANELLADLSVNKKGWYTLGKIDNAMAETPTVTKVDGKDVYEQASEADTNRVVGMLASMEKTDNHSFPTDKIDIGGWSLHGADGANDFSGVTPSAWHLDGTVTIVTYTWKDELAPDNAPLYGPVVNWASSVPENNVEAPHHDGYVFDKWVSTTDKDGDVTITATYVVDDSQTKDLAATVDYSYGGTVDSERHVDLTATVQVLQPDTLSTAAAPAKAKDGYKLDSITVNGTAIEGTTIPETVNNGDKVVYVYVVDDSQTKDLAATVDYSYGGTVDAERHVDLTATVQVLQPDTLSTAAAPAKAKDGYKLDSITVNGTAIEGTTIPETVNNGDKVVYVYVVDDSQTKDLAATVDYSYGGTVDAERHVDLTATVQVLQPDTLSTAAAPAKAKDGYKLDSITVNGTAIEGTTIPETVNNGDKVVYVYVVDDSQTKDLAATVDYSYGGTVDAERHVDLTATVQVLQPDTLSTAAAPAKAKDGYKLDSITVNGTAIEGTTIPETVNNGDKVVYVYVVDDSQTKDLAATVDYSYGGTVDAERHVDLTATVQVLQPDTLSTAAAPAKAKDGYKLDSITVNGTAIEGTTIPETVNNGDKVVYVYVVDDSQTKDLAATVDYSYGGTVDAERHVDLTATVQVLQPDTLSTAAAPAKAKDGYKLDSITVNGTAIEGTTIPETVNNGDKVVYVYVVDDSQTKDLAATVDYSYGGTVDAERHVDLTATVQVLQPDTLSTAAAPAKAKDGYKLDSITVNGTAIEGTTIPETVNNGDKVVYVYVVDDSQTKDLAATVDYSYGGTVDAERHVDLTATVQVLQPDTLSTAAAPAKAKDGYKLDSITVNGTAIEGTTIPETVNNGDKVVYVYVVDDSQTKDLAATVDYSYGGTVDAERHVDLTATVQVLQPDTLSTAAAPAKAKDGYKLDSITVNGTAIEGTTIPETVNNGDKVVYVYVVDDSQTKDLAATVDYSYGGTVDAERHVDLTATVQVLQPDTLSTAAAPAKAKDGYKLDSITVNGTAIEGTTIPETVNNGDKVVYVYVRDSFPYTVNYVDESGNALLEPKTGAPREFEFTVNSTGEVIAIAGYVFERADKDSITIGANADDNVITLTYAVDVIVDPDVNDPDPVQPGDGVADKYQAVINYVSANNAQGTVNVAQRVETFTAPATSGTVNIFDGVTPNPTAGFVFDGWTEDGNAVASNLTRVLQGNTEYTFTANWALDVIGTDPTDPGNNVPDGIADKYQLVVTYAAIAGTIDGPARYVLNKYDAAGNLAEDGAAVLTAAQIPGATADDGYGNGVWNNEPLANMELTDNTNFIIAFTALPAATPDATPAAPLAPVAAAAPAAAAAAAATILDDGVPLATIDDDENALAAFEEIHCWTHWLIDLRRACHHRLRPRGALPPPPRHP